MVNKKKTIIIAVSILAVIIVAFMAWNRWASTTRIALVNFQQFQTTSIVKSNGDKFIDYDVVAIDDLDRLSKYDCVLAFGMGLSIDNEQRELIQKIADKGTPLMVFAATNPDNNITNLDSTDVAALTGYLSNGNRHNNQSLGRYIRQNIDKKRFFVTPPDSLTESANDVFYHLDDEVWFDNAADYEQYLKTKGFYTEGGAKVAIVGGLNDPFSGNKESNDSLIAAFQQAGCNVYPISSMMQRVKLLQEVQPDAVVYFAHGRLAMGQGDAAVAWLKSQNIPMFAPLTILQTRKEWEADAMGMFGGFMSQSLVMPELDGAIYPYIVNSQEQDNDGLFVFRAIPDRLHSLVAIVNNFVTLKHKANADKKLAIYFFKGPGQESLAAQGLETVPALYNLLKRLKAEGYKVNLPSTEEEFRKMLMLQSEVMSTYAKGAFDHFLTVGQPALVERSDYEKWAADAMPASLYADVVKLYGEAPGSYMSVEKDDKAYLAVARIDLGNVALLPQPMAALSSDAFAIVHGAKTAPPHTYIAAYLWGRYDFKADAILHFGAHGSLEFTPQKQVALSSYDWPDRLVGTTPHFYYYTIANVGESMMAKRRSYATVVSYLTPAFMEADLRSTYSDLENKILTFDKSEGKAREQASLAVKKIAVKMGIHRYLRLDSVLTTPYNDEDIERIGNYAEEIANEKMAGQLYVTGVPYDKTKIESTVVAMSADPIAYSIASLDVLRKKTTDKQLKNSIYFTQHYLNPAKRLVKEVLNGRKADEALVCSLAGVDAQTLAEAPAAAAPPRRSMSMSMPKSNSKAAEKEKNAGGGHPWWIPKVGKRPEETKTAEEKAAKTTAQPHGNTTAAKAMPDSKPAAEKVYTAEQKAEAKAVLEIQRTVENIVNYRQALLESPEMELKNLLNALAGGYVAPSSGGDAVANPQALPTGRNLYAINAEATPTEAAWEKAKELVESTLESYKKQHGDYPKKVSYTFWSSEFIESGGATIAQALYMLGVEPLRDGFGRVSDIQLIPSEKLGRPRVDIVVQTSGQFRDLAASRLMLLARAVEMAAAATDDKNGNYVASETTEVEKQLVEQGIAPKDARALSTQRIFGGINGMYGTNIQGMVTAGDSWENEQEIADTYINNMGALYGSDDSWGDYRAGLLRAVLHNTDIVIQPRQSNTWGALSLDHVYEFMGGMTLAVRNVTGKDPETYFADYRNRNRAIMQDVKEAIGIEASATILNPTYIKEVLKGKASSAGQITEVVTNTYAWNVMKPSAIDNELWDDIYEVYIKDSYGLNTTDFFKRENPDALQEITAVMLETARKGMWKASDEQLNTIATMHTDLVTEFGHSGGGFSGNNRKLQQYIASHAPANASAYNAQLQKMQTGSAAEANVSGKVLKKQTVQNEAAGSTNLLNGSIIAAVVLATFAVLVILIRRKRKKE